MKSLLRESAVGLGIQLARAIAFLTVYAVMRAQLTADRAVKPQAGVVQPAFPAERPDQLMQRTAARVETTARRILGWLE